MARAAGVSRLLAAKYLAWPATFYLAQFIDYTIYCPVRVPSSLFRMIHPKTANAQHLRSSHNDPCRRNPDTGRPRTLSRSEAGTVARTDPAAVTTRRRSTAPGTACGHQTSPTCWARPEQVTREHEGCCARYSAANNVGSTSKLRVLMIPTSVIPTKGTTGAHMKLSDSKGWGR